MHGIAINSEDEGGHSFNNEVSMCNGKYPITVNTHY